MLKQALEKSKVVATLGLGCEQPEADIYCSCQRQLTFVLSNSYPFHENT